MMITDDDGDAAGLVVLVAVAVVAAVVFVVGLTPAVETVNWSCLLPMARF